MNIYERRLDPPEDRRAVCFTCACCGEPIREGDEYFDFRDLGVGILCESCIRDAHHYDAEREAM